MLNKIPLAWRDALDRAGRSAVQKFLLIAFAAVPGVHIVTGAEWYAAVGTGLGAGVLSLIMSVLSWKVPQLTYWPDLGLRLARSFLQSLLTTWGADAVNLFHISWRHSLLVALGMAGMSFVTNYLGGNPANPSVTKLSNMTLLTYSGGGGGGGNFAYSSPTQEFTATSPLPPSEQSADPNAVDQSTIPLASPEEDGS